MHKFDNLMNNIFLIHPVLKIAYQKLVTFSNICIESFRFIEMQPQFITSNQTFYFVINNRMLFIDIKTFF